jgi:thiamine-monophosphate kinase
MESSSLNAVSIARFYSLLQALPGLPDYSRPMPRLSEFQLIAQMFAPLATAPGAFGLMDDAAIIPACEGADLVVTTDALVEGVHFFANDPPDTVAKKALRVNLSDLAAKGAVPHGYLLALSLPASIDMPWLESFARGLSEDQVEFSLSLLGGDTTATPGPLSIAITAFGHVPAGTIIRRAGAVPGDLVFVSGTIGDGGGGLAVLKGEEAAPSHREPLISRYRLPMPRLALGQALRGIATASLDISDGLLADLGHIAEASGVRIVVEAERIPRSAALAALWGEGMDAIVRAATSGDDYEIAFTAPSLPQGMPTPVTCVGRVEQGSGLVLLDAQGRDVPVPRAGYRHF